MFLLFLLFTVSLNAYFIPTHKSLEPFYEKENVILITSMGRSGSTMLKEIIAESSPSHIVLKSHILPPRPDFKGKILFIFSNPDKAAESALHLSMQDEVFGQLHFHHMESSDRSWLDEITDTRFQTVEHNLLAQDALGITKQMKMWLEDTRSCPFEDAQILAVKYEDLWKPRTNKAIELFLSLDRLEIPPYKQRGYLVEELLPQELEFRIIYNLGTWEEPIYSAYDEARELWKKEPSFRFLKIGE